MDFSYSVLIDCLKIDKIPKDNILSNTVQIYHDTDEIPVIRLYHKLCEENGLDDGEPFSYHTVFVINEEMNTDHSFEFWGPLSTISRLCNIVAICTNSILGHIQLLISHDNYETCSSTFVVNPQTPEIFDYDDTERPLKFDELHRFWNQENELGTDRNYDDPISIALNHFFYSWRASYHYVPTCINLAITLEALFAPHSHLEISHQIAFNISRFLGRNKKEREETYKRVKKFYNVRSQIIHGSIPKMETLVNIVPNIYFLTCEIFRNILNDSKTFSIFYNSNLRKEQFNDWLFK